MFNNYYDKRKQTTHFTGVNLFLLKMRVKLLWKVHDE